MHVGRMDRARQGLHQRGGLRGAQASRSAAPRGCRLQVLQREERPAVVGADLKDLHDVGMLEPRQGFGLGAEGASSSARRVRRTGSF